jgi:hypothetical protein
MGRGRGVQSEGERGVYARERERGGGGGEREIRGDRQGEREVEMIWRDWEG